MSKPEITNSKMDDIVKDVQKKLVCFCNILPVHVEMWKQVLQEVQDPVKALANFAEQLRFVELANIKYMNDFDHVQKELQTKILDHIEEELESVKAHAEKLNRSNHDFKNKLAAFEKATIDLDWDLDTPVVKGSPIQPPLNKLLQMAYEFWTFFLSASKNINSKIKTLNVRDEKSVAKFQKSCSLNLEVREEHRTIYQLLAITQYVINDKAVT